MKDLADVTERARGIRRRRAAWMGAGAAILVIAATIGVIVATRDDDRQLVNLTPDTTQNVPTTVTAPATTVPETVAAVVPTTVVPATTVPATLDPSTATTVQETVVTETVQPTTTVAEAATTVPEPTTTLAETTTTVVAPVVTRPIVAIDANGDAVIVALDGTVTVLTDGPDPDDPPPAEGESYVLDHVDVTDDGSVAFVVACCEPVPGTILRYQLPDTTNNTSAYGHAATISPDGTKVATDVLQAVSVRDLDLNEIATTAEDFLTGSGNGFVWLDNERFVLLEALPDSVKLHTMTLGADNALVGGNTSQWNEIDGFGVSLAGTGDGVIYLHGVVAGTLLALDMGTLSHQPASDIVLPGEAISVWMQDGQLRWVGTDRQLHVGDTVVPGQYIWVR